MRRGGLFMRTGRCCRNASAPDTDLDDRAAVETLVRDHGHEIAQCRTGSALTKYSADIPELDGLPPLRWFAPAGTKQLAALNRADTC